jgi:hypothetical protein
MITVNRTEESFVTGLTRLYNRLDSLEKRLANPLRPSTYTTGQRSIDALEAQAAGFQRRFGYNPFGNGQTANLRTGMGTMDVAHQVAAMMRLANIAQHAGLRGDTRELVRMEAELKRIRAIAEKTYKYDTDPNAQANLRRIRDAAYVGEQRIVSGLSGNARHGAGAFAALTGGRYSNMMATVGRLRGGYAAVQAGMSRGGIGGIAEGLGALGGLEGAAMIGGTAAAGVGLGLGVAFAPNIASAAYRKLYSMQAPWLNFRIASADLGRAGGFNSRDLERMILPQGFLKNEMGAFAGAGIPERMKRLGLSPQQVLQNIGYTGVVPTTAEGAFGTAASIRSAYLSPNMGLSEQQLGNMLGQGYALGTVKPGAENKYFETLQRVMTVATGAGLDRSRVGSTMSSLLQGAASAGALSSPNFNALGDMWNRLVQSGAPGMRSGEGVVSYANAVNASLGSMGIGGDVGKTTILQSFLMRTGGLPKSEDALRRRLGVSKKDWDSSWVSGSAAQQALQAYLQAANDNNPLALNYLSALTVGHPEIADTIFSGSAFGNMPDYQKQFFAAQFKGVPLGQEMANASNNGGSLGATGVGTPSQRTNSVMWFLKNHLGLTTNQAAGVASNLFAESGMIPTALNKSDGGLGIAQWTDTRGSPRRSMMESWIRAHGGNPSSLDDQMEYLVWDMQGNHPDILQNIQRQTTATGAAVAAFQYESGGSRRLAMMHLGDHTQYAEQFAANYRDNQPNAELQKGAAADTGDLMAAKRIDDLTNGVFSAVTAGFRSVADVTDHVVAALARFQQRLDHTQLGSGPATGTYDVPGGPANNSNNIRK